MTTSSAPILAFGRTAYGRSATRSSTIPSCAAIASDPLTYMSPSGRDIDAVARAVSDIFNTGRVLLICSVVVSIEPLLKEERARAGASSEPVRGCPSPRKALAILRRDTTARPSHRSCGRERRGLPKQCRGRPTLQANPTNHNNRSVPNAGEPNPRPLLRMTGVRVPATDHTTGRRVPARTLAIPDLHKVGRRTRAG